MSWTDVSSRLEVGSSSSRTWGSRTRDLARPLLFPVHRDADMVTGLVFKKQKTIIPAIRV